MYTDNIVIYAVVNQYSGETSDYSKNRAALLAEPLLKQYLTSLDNYKVINCFVDKQTSIKSQSWEQLKLALNSCKSYNSRLIIFELGALTNNDSFTNLLIDSKVEFYCCDQPFINKEVLQVLSQHAQVQKKIHGNLIKQGLKLTSAKSGNPNAAQVINKVNKPKIDTAILFGFLIQPIIKDYQKKGFSQRQMVQKLNYEGFSAPEGGKWVLSQLQKVLDRVKVNDMALSLWELLDNSSETSTTELVDKLNEQQIIALRRGGWSVDQVEQVKDRINQIKNIMKVNEVLISLMPFIKNMHQKETSNRNILNKLEAIQD